MPPTIAVIGRACTPCTPRGWCFAFDLADLVGALRCPTRPQLMSVRSKPDTKQTMSVAGQRSETMRRRLDLRLAADFVAVVDFAARRLSMTRTDYVRSALIAKLRDDGVDPLRPPRTARPRKPPQQEAA